MSENVVIDIDTFEIVEDGKTNESSRKQKWNDYGRALLTGRPYYKPSSLLWEYEEDGVIHQLKPLKNKEGIYVYWQKGKNKDWGHNTHLSRDEALWKTLEYVPELVSFI